MSGLNQAVPESPSLLVGNPGNLAGPLVAFVCWLALAVVPAGAADLPTESGDLQSGKPAVLEASMPAPSMPVSSMPVSLTGLSARDLLGDIPPPTIPGRVPVDQPIPLSDVTSDAPVAIPFPAAIHLFGPGALIVIYATRRFRRR